MKTSAKIMLAIVSTLSVAACSGATEEESAQDVTTEEAAPAPAASEAAVATSSEVFEVCDENGKSYPSEADAEAAGLDRAEYGATFCDQAE